jgi:hypothetical protein
LVEVTQWRFLSSLGSFGPVVSEKIEVYRRTTTTDAKLWQKLTLSFGPGELKTTKSSSWGIKITTLSKHLAWDIYIVCMPYFVVFSSLEV